MSAPLPASEDAEVQFTQEYKNSAIAQREIAKQADRGLHLVGMSTINQNPGCLRWLLLGWLSLIFKPQPHVLVVYRGKAAGQRRFLAAQAEMKEQLRAQEREALALRTPLQQWLHTPLGAGMVIGAFVLAIAVSPLFHMDAPYLLPLVSIFLAVVDWPNFSTFHGAIAWKTWKLENRNWSYYGLGAILWLYGWLFMPLVYAAQAFGGAKAS